jgi:hypothetical protein
LIGKKEQTMTKTIQKLNVHNTYYIVASVDPAAIERAKDSIVHPFMVPLIEAIQHKRPHWEFHARGFGNRGIGDDVNHVLHDNFDIYDNGEKIGSIDKDYHAGRAVYAAGSHRINAKRLVGMRKKSKHVKVIAAEVLKECYPLTLDELASEKYKKSHNAMTQATYKDRRAYTRNVELLHEPMLAYLTSGDRWAEFLAAQDTPSVMRAKEAYHSLAENARVADNIANAHHILLIERPRDIVIKPFNGAAQSTNLDQLPDHTKTSLALLKMTEKDTIIDGVGIRTADDTFYILTSNT